MLPIDLARFHIDSINMQRVSVLEKIGSIAREKSKDSRWRDHPRLWEGGEGIWSDFDYDLKFYFVRNDQN